MMTGATMIAQSASAPAKSPKSGTMFRRRPPTASPTCRACGRTTPRHRSNVRRRSKAAPLLTPQEVAAMQKRSNELFGGDGDAAFGDAIYEAVLSDVQKYKPTTFDKDTGNYNAFWIVGREFENRTSLITDPPDGRLPPQTEASKKRFQDDDGRPEGPRVRRAREPRRCPSAASRSAFPISSPATTATTRSFRAPDTSRSCPNGFTTSASFRSTAGRICPRTCARCSVTPAATGKATPW